MTIRNLQHAHHPRSLAVFGASEREGSVGAVVMRNILLGVLRNPERKECVARAFGEFLAPSGN